MRRIHAAMAALALLASGARPAMAQGTPAGQPAVSDTTPRRWSATDIGTLSAKELGDVIATSLLGGLRGRMAGVRVVQSSGEPGSEIRIRLRGATTISGDQDPLIIIDGTISRGVLADIAADDVERIEVLKGPSASAIYGSDGAAGVILVFTRRGREGPEGKFQVWLRNEVGPSSMTARVGEAGAHPFEITTGSGGVVAFAHNGVGDLIVKTDHIADNPFPSYHDHQSELYLTGLFLANHLSVGWHKGPTNVAASLDNMHDAGTVFGLSGLQRRNLRLNADQRLGPVEIALSGFYGTSDRELPPVGLGPFFAMRFLFPHVDLLATNPDGSPYRAEMPDHLVNASNPLYALANQTNTSDGQRLMGGVTVRWHPVRWLAIEGSHHAEREKVDSTTVIPVGYLSGGGGAGSGFTKRTFFTGRSHNTDAALVVTRDWNRVTNKSRIGYVYESHAFDDSAKSASGTIPPSTSGSSSSDKASVKSAYATTSFVFNDRYILDAGARRDVMSFLAPSTRTQWYYRAAAAWRANEDLRIAALDELRLHVAYGIAGQRPGFSFAFVPLGTTVTPLRAPRSGELEAGISLITSGGRFSLDYAYSRKTTRDVIEVGAVPTPIGFTEVGLNAGTLQATTHELTLGYAVARKPGLDWSLTLTGDRVRGRITEYNLPERLLGFDTQQPAIFLVAAGQELGVMYGNRFVRTIAELNDDPAKKALSGPGQAFDPAGFVVNEEGYVVSKASWRCGEDLQYRDGRGACTQPERPILYAKAVCFTAGNCQTTQSVPIGNSTPDFVVGLQSSFHYKRLGFSGLLDWSQGGDIYNAGRQWSFISLRDPVFDQRGKPAAEQKSIDYYTTFYNSLGSNALFVESGTYLKLREVALTYEFRLGGLDHVRVGLVGRNLLTLTGYSGYDPEVGSGPDPFLGRVDWFQYPHFRTISGMVEIAF